MSTKRLALLVTAAVLLGSGLACALGGGPEPTPTPAPTYTPEPTYTSAPSPTPTPEPTDTPVPTHTPQMVEPETSSADLELVAFADPEGVFELYIPAGLDLIEETNEPDEYGLTFSNPDGDVVVLVTASILADTAFTDSEWDEMVESLGDEKLGTELDRIEGDPGVHFVYMEGVDEVENLHSAMWVEESQGVLMIYLAMTSVERWPEWEGALIDSLADFTWASDAMMARTSSGSQDTIVRPTEENQVAIPTTYFEDPNGIFTLDYPQALTKIVQDDTDSGYSYTFSTEDEAVGIMVVFSYQSDQPFTDAEWQDQVDSFSDMLSTERVRQAGDPGEHYLYIEGEAAESDVYDMMWVEESNGIVMGLLGVTPVEEWPDWETSFGDALDSFLWSSAAVHEYWGAGSEETVINPPPPTATTEASTEFPAEWYPPAGKASIVLVNDATADLVFTMNNQEHKLVANTSKVAIYDPGTYTYTASDPRFDSHNAECTLNANTIYYWHTDDSSWGSCVQIYP